MLKKGEGYIRQYIKLGEEQFKSNAFSEMLDTYSDAIERANFDRMYLQYNYVEHLTKMVMMPKTAGK